MTEPADDPPDLPDLLDATEGLHEFGPEYNDLLLLPPSVPRRASADGSEDALMWRERAPSFTEAQNQPDAVFFLEDRDESWPAWKKVALGTAVVSVAVAAIGLALLPAPPPSQEPALQVRRDVEPGTRLWIEGRTPSLSATVAPALPWQAPISLSVAASTPVEPSSTPVPPVDRGVALPPTRTPVSIPVPSPTAARRAPPVAAPPARVSAPAAAAAASPSPSARSVAPAVVTTVPATPSQVAVAVAPPPPAASAPSAAAPASPVAVPPAVAPEPARAVPTPAAAVVPVPPPHEVETNAIQGVLGRYRTAYNQLDARAAAAVWPTVDERTLARAFERIDDQTVSFDNCQIQVGGVMAEAVCTGMARFVPKVGSRTPRTQARRWRFLFRRTASGWLIDNVDAR